MSKRTCIVEGCERDLWSRGMCSPHYKRMRKYGSTDLRRPARSYTSAEERFWAKVDKTDTCWLWTAQIVDNGYGHFHYEGKNRGAHRVSWLLAGGELPPGMQIDHICHVKHCVRPSHLRLATKSQNRQNFYDGTDFPTASGVRGVWPHGKGWQAVVYVDRVIAYRERFGTIEEAAEAVVAARLRLHTHNDRDRLPRTA